MYVLVVLSKNFTCSIRDQRTLLRVVYIGQILANLHVTVSTSVTQTRFWFGSVRYSLCTRLLYRNQ
ncbi:hypothetical protein BDQ12DRAFT_568 [Crucibulum laeve]|uniref:Uncharacterized protein n=1 Tax=Crucibulum laeve TaxID=68775 RepID=A0A5C3MGI5_9AGAR|nr:hypothetical protein BDQ12DRAFT_568 [Crucibulum laeve]